MTRTRQRIGVVSDTHGLLRPQAMAHLRDCDLILHGGDIGDIALLTELQALAPVIAVRGNVDNQGEVARLPATQVVEIGGHWLYMLHNLDELDLDPYAADFSAVIFGHTHQPSAYRRQGVLYFNPGSIGPKRWHLPVSMGFIDIIGAQLEAQHITLDMSA